MTLSDTFYLGRSSRYANPLNGNDRLPIVYGDMTDGTSGIWKLPCIDTVNHVYCFAAHEVLSVAGGNSVSVYVDGVLQSSGYAFDESNDHESLGAIATVTFTADQENKIVTARGSGKVLTGTTLMENIIDIVNDVLTVENNFTSSIYEATKKAQARQVFESQSYKAAGAIVSDVELWKLVTEMMATFLGSAYLDGSGLLALDIDNGQTIQTGAGHAIIVRKSETVLIDARQRLANIINQCPANYCYNYDSGEFKRHTNSSAYADAVSQSVYGVREPNTPFQLYWCRDLTSVNVIQQIIVAKFKDPIYEIEIEDRTLKHMNIDIGDPFVCSIDSLYDKAGYRLINHYWRTVAVSPDFSRAKVRFRALQTGAYMTTGGGTDRDLTIY